MTDSGCYLLGCSEAEQARLDSQSAVLAPVTQAQLDRLGIKPGERVIDLGCGPGYVLSLLAERVGPGGSVIGLERDARFASLARRYVAERALSQVEVIEGDAFDTGQPRASFDGAHMRLVLVNVPDPQRIVREMASLVRPGGWVASFEADLLSLNCDPPSAEWIRLLDAYKAYSDAQGIDLCIGRRTHSLFRAAGVTDIHVEAVAYVSSARNPGRLILLDFVNNVREKMIEQGFIGRAELESDVAAVERHLSDPDVLVTSHLFYQLSGRVPR
ncbi:methyltransferase domain-containing protein [Methylocystis sp.]|uniref:methyltransferase domain-containing protein n=1 Tax=Methylocystis sp. TaxID=1911079 RepID=UPI0025E7B4EF|nr:methyltransferase domain-containing protein [Methylocystis sp.]